MPGADKDAGSQPWSPVFLPSAKSDIVPTMQLRPISTLLCRDTPSSRAAFFGSAILICLLLAPALRAESCKGPTMQAAFTSDGAYSVEVLTTGIALHGKTSTSGNVQRADGHDALGSYCELSFRSDPTAAKRDSIRVYQSSPTVTFSVHADRATTTPLTFPTLAGFPTTLHPLGYRVEPFGGFQFNFLGSQGPWVLFDDKSNALVLSPADHFFVSDMEMQQNTMHSTMVASIHDLPASFTHTTVLVAGKGIHTTLASWGHAMQAWAGRPAVANDADTLLRSLSYWTDNGAAYYYKFDPQLGYTGTLLAIAKKYQQADVPLRLMQIDSWFYPKGPQKDWQAFNWKNGAGGAYLYEPDKRLFPSGMGAFAQQLQLPLAVHGRWIDQSSPYRTMYKMSGNVIVDPRYWEVTAAWMQAAHVIVYEQDWLGSFAQAAPDLTSPQMYHDMMAHAMQQHAITMQYCMPAPADYMQGTRYANLTSIRTSDDRFEAKKWDQFLYDSQIAYALGIWPWTDVFMSDEQANLVLSTLSSGPVGVGDMMDRINAENLQQAVRGDGVIVKPDRGIRPLDRIYLADAQNQVAQNQSGAMIAVAATDQPAGRVSYVFAYPRKAETSASFTPEELGYAGKVFVYDWRNAKGTAIAASTSFPLPIGDGWGYAVVAPVAENGLALIGDPQLIATAGKKRLSARIDASGALAVRVRFVAGEQEQTLLLYAAHAPQVKIVSGHLGDNRYDTQTNLLRIALTPDPDGYAEVSLSRSSQP